MTHEVTGLDVEKYALLCQQTSPKRWFGNMEMASNCDVSNSTPNTNDHRMTLNQTPPPWKFSAYVPDLNSKGYSNLAQTRFQTSTFLSFVMQFLGKVLLTIKVFIVFWMFSKGLLSNITTESPKILRMFPQKFCPPPKKSQKILPKKFAYV